MTGKQFRLAVLGFIGCAFLVNSTGCDSAPKPTIDTSSEIKAPEKPTTTRVDVKPGGAAKGGKLK